MTSNVELWITNFLPKHQTLKNLLRKAHHAQDIAEGPEGISPLNQDQWNVLQHLIDALEAAVSNLEQHRSKKEAQHTKHAQDLSIKIQELQHRINYLEGANDVWPMAKTNLKRPDAKPRTPTNSTQLAKTPQPARKRIIPGKWRFFSTSRWTPPSST